MNPPDDPIEVLLRRLEPAPPDEALMNRLRAARPGRPLLRLAWAAPLAAAAAIALALLLQPKPGPPAADPLAAQPSPVIENRSHLMDVHDLGLVHGPGDQVVRLVRTTWIDEIGRADEPDKPRESYLREEIVPVALPVY